MKGKGKFKKVMRQILAFALATTVVIGSWAIGFVLQPPHENLWGTLLGITTILIVAAAIVSVVGNRILNKKIENAKVRAAYEYGENLKETILANRQAAKKRIQKTIIAINLYVVALIVLFMFLNFCMGCVTNHNNEDVLAQIIIFAIISAFSVGGLFCYFLPTVSSDSSDAALEQFRLSEKDFPLLNDIAARAAKTAKCTKPIRLYLNGDGIAVQEQNNHISLHLSHLYASVLTKDELYNVLLHEFAHVAHADTKLSAKFESAQERVSAVDDNVILAFGQLLFLRLPATILSFRIVLFLTIINRDLEAAADESVKANGDAQIYSNALSKSYMLGQYEEKPSAKVAYDYYSAETCTGDYASRECAAFSAEREKMGKIWEEYLQKELPAKIDSHPTAIVRINNMGCSSFNAYAEETDEFFRTEQQKLIQFADKIITETAGPYYAEYRQQAYLDRKKAIDDYEKCCESDTAPSESLTLEAMQALFGLDDEKAIEIADKIIHANPDASQANFLKGIILFYKYDDNCISCFKAAAKAHLYAEGAYDFLGRYALKTGNAELLSEYRATVPEVVQDARDKSQQTQFTRKTPVEPHDLTDEEITALSQGLVAATDDKISKIYVCKYTDPFGEPHYEVVIGLRAVRNTNTMWSVLGIASEFLQYHSDKHRFHLSIGSYTLHRKIIKADHALIYDRRTANKKQ